MVFFLILHLFVLFLQLLVVVLLLSAYLHITLILHLTDEYASVISELFSISLSLSLLAISVCILSVCQIINSSREMLPHATMLAKISHSSAWHHRGSGTSARHSELIH